MFSREFALQNPKENPYLDWIKAGVKTFEGRTSDKVADLKKGDMIKLYDRNDIDSQAICEITELRYYEDFGKAFDELGEKLIPKRNKSEVISMYNLLYEKDNKFEDGVTCDHIKKLGVVAIGIKVIK